MPGNKRRSFLILLAAILILMLTATVVAQTPTPTPTATPTVEPLDEDEATPPTLEDLLAPEEEDEEEVDEEEVEVDEVGTLDLTVYGENLGLVREVRRFDLEEGLNEIAFTDVASRIRPTTVHVVSLTDPDETLLLEQHFAYDIVSTRQLLQRHIDLPISLTTRDGETHTGTLLSGEEDIILGTDDGITILRLEHVQQFTFPELPDGLVTRPTLQWLLQTGLAGPHDLQVAYLTGGISWQADYIALLGSDNDELSLTGWVSVDNRSGATYENARLKLIAGDVAQVTPDIAPAMAEDMVMRAVPEVQVEQRAFFDFHLYEVPRPVTIGDRQTKQIEFARAPEVDVEREYVVQFTRPIFVRLGSAITDPNRVTREPMNAEIRILVMNDEESGLGMPLPQGIVRVYQEDVDGSAQFVGEDRIRHTPRGEEISLTLGRAFDILAERTPTAFRQLGERQIEETIRIDIRNQQDEAVTVRVIEHLFRAHDADVIETSMEFEEIDANTIAFEVEIDAEGTATLEYTVVYRW